jgi:hypothetical protein
MLSVVADEAVQAELRMDLDGLAREGARRMLAAALEAEVDDDLAAAAADRDEHGRRLVVRNGHARTRAVLTTAGAVAVGAPRVNDRRVDPVSGERARFRSVLVPPWCRRSREGGRRAAAVVPAWAVHRRLRPRAGGVLRLVGGALGAGHHPAGRRLAGRRPGVLPA